MIQKYNEGFIEDATVNLSHKEENMNAVPPRGKNADEITTTNPSPTERNPNTSPEMPNSDQEREPVRRYDEADPNWENPDVQMHSNSLNQMVDIPEVNDFTVAP